jgi:tetratricopeptide (TPR) repeat protein
LNLHFGFEQLLNWRPGMDLAATGGAKTETPVAILGSRGNGLDRKRDMPLLHWACGRGHLRFVKLLLRAGANTEKQDGFGRTPMQIAMNAAGICTSPSVTNVQRSRLLGTPGNIVAAADEIIALLRRHGAAEPAPPSDAELREQRARARAVLYLDILPAASCKRWDAYASLYRAVLAIDREDGDRRHEAHSLQQLGYAADQSGAFSDAERYYEMSLGISRELKDRREEAATLGHLALALKHLDQAEKAEQLLHQSLAIWETLDGEAKIEEEARLYYALSCLAEERGDLKLAIERTERALTLAETGDAEHKGKLRQRLEELTGRCAEK